MLKGVAFKEWAPDLANNVLSKAVNVHAIANGFTPVKAALGATPALSSRFNGGGTFISSTGVSTLIAANLGAYFKYTTSGWAAIGTGFTQVARNYFAQFGDDVIFAVGSAHPVRIYNLVSGSLNYPAPTPAPYGIDIAQVRDFVMCITTDNKARWCQFNNPADWTIGTNQADEQPSLWGQMRRIVGGEYALILTDRSVVRVSYVGSLNDIIFQFDEIAPEVGCMAAGSVCYTGRLVFFLSERGFEMCDGQTVTPIGDEKFNRWFFDTYSRADIADIWGAIDPRNSRVTWAMPGTPGRILEYNWVLQRASTIETDVTGLMTGYAIATPIDALDAIYGNLDAIPLSLDDPSFQGGNPALLIADGSNVLGTFAGRNLEATLQVDNVEPTPGRRSRIRELRLVSDATDASATLNARMRAGDAESIVSTATMRSNGKLPIRANGRYNDLEVTIPAGADWSFIQGCEVEFDPGGGR